MPSRATLGGYLSDSGGTRTQAASEVGWLAFYLFASFTATYQGTMPETAAAG